MSKTVIIVFFKVGDDEYKISLPYNMSFRQWDNIGEADYNILVDYISEQINLYKKAHKIIDPIEPDSIEFAPHFYGVD